MQHNNRANRRSIILLVTIASLYISCGMAVAYIWFTHHHSVKETQKVLRETKNSAEDVVKEKLEKAGRAIQEATDKTRNLLGTDEDEQNKAEAAASARAAREEKLSDLKRRKNQLDLMIAEADARHRAAIQTVPVTPAFEIGDSEATRQASAQQMASRAKLRKEADDAGCELRKLKIERQNVLQEIRRLEK